MVGGMVGQRLRAETGEVAAEEVVPAKVEQNRTQAAQCRRKVFDQLPCQRMAVAEGIDAPVQHDAGTEQVGVGGGDRSLAKVAQQCPQSPLILGAGQQEVGQMVHARVSSRIGCC